MAGTRNLKAGTLALSWKTDAEREQSLHKVYEYVETEGAKARDWYYQRKEAKRFFSGLFRYLAIALSAVAGLLPVVMALWPKAMERGWLAAIKPERPELVVSLALGLAAALVGLDRFGDFSTGWIRYIKYAAAIERILQEFRIDWNALLAHACSAAGAPMAAAAAAGAGSSATATVQPRLSVSDAEALIDRARQVVLSIQDAVSRETSEWAAQFESNLSKLESDLRTQWQEREKEVKEKLSTMQPGHVFVTISNALDADQRQFELTLTSGAGQQLERVERTGENTWFKMGLLPGTYAVSVSGTFNQRRGAVHRVFEIKPGKREDLTLELPK